MATKRPVSNVLDENHYFTCERRLGGRFHYKVWSRSPEVVLGKSSPHVVLFSTSCKASSVAHVKAHATVELRRFLTLREPEFVVK